MASLLSAYSKVHDDSSQSAEEEKAEEPMVVDDVPVDA